MTNDANEAQVFCVSTQKGGQGKSTTTMNSAAEMAHDGLKVVVVDVDPQQTVAEWAEEAGDKLPFDFASSTDPGILAGLKKLDYDVIVVDTPGSLQDTEVLDAVLNISDFVILPLAPEPVAIKPLKRTVREHVEPRGLPYKILLNRIDMRNGEGELEDWRGIVDQVLKMPRFDTHIRKSQGIVTAPLAGEVITDFADNRRNRNAIFDYTKYGTELMEIYRALRAGKEVI